LDVEEDIGPGRSQTSLLKVFALFSSIVNRNELEKAGVIFNDDIKDSSSTDGESDGFQSEE
jgi:hypothetical protein